MKLWNFFLFALSAALCPCSKLMAEEPLSTKTLQRISVEVTPRVLTPARSTNTTGQLVLMGVYSDGSSDPIALDKAVITARTKAASGNVQVIRLQGAKVVPEEGGVATIEATLSDVGQTFTAATEVVVEPYYRDYHQTLVLKLFLGMEGQPVERLAKEPMFLKPHDVFHTFEQALDIMRKTDHVTRGIPKIIYLVGWQKGGHDHGYPDWSEVNPRLKRAQDATALDSLRWLIREGRKFNTTVSLHLNMVDAYQQSPLWDEYVAKDCFARDESGKLLVGGIQMKGEDMYNVVYPKEWEAGLAQRRIDGLIRMIPELQDGHTIHIDVFIANRDGGRPISPWHLKPENGGLTPEKYVETNARFSITGGTGVLISPARARAGRIRPANTSLACRRCPGGIPGTPWKFRNASVPAGGRPATVRVTSALAKACMARPSGWPRAAACRVSWGRSAAPLFRGITLAAWSGRSSKTTPCSTARGLSPRTNLENASSAKEISCCARMIISSFRLCGTKRRS